MATTMPREGTLLTETSAQNLEEAINRLERTLASVERAISAPNRGLAGLIERLIATFDKVFDPEKAIVARALTLNRIDQHIDRRLLEIKDLLAGVPAESKR